MKKLLLLLLTLLAFAPPGAKAQDKKTINILSTDGVDFYVTGKPNNGKDAEATNLITGTNRDGFAWPIQQVSKIYNSDIQIDFDFSNIPESYSLYCSSIYKPGAINLYGRDKFTISDPTGKYYIKEIRFYGAYSTYIYANSTVATTATYKAYTRNLKGPNGEELNLPETDLPTAEASKEFYFTTWKCGNDKSSSVTFSIPDKFTYGTSQTNTDSSGNKSYEEAYTPKVASEGDHATTAFVVRRLEIDLEEIPRPLPSPVVIVNGSSVASEGTMEFENSTSMYFGTNNQSELNGATVYYTVVPENETPTVFPVGDEAAAAGIESTLMGSNHPVTLSEGGKLYFWAYNAEEGRKSNPTYITATRFNRLTFFKYKGGNPDGKVIIYSDRTPAGAVYTTPTSSGTEYRNVKRIVFIPNEPNNKDAIILDVTSGALNITQKWAVFDFNQNTYFTLRSQNGTVLSKIIFDCTSGTVTSPTNPQCYNIVEDAPVGDGTSNRKMLVNQTKYRFDISPWHTQNFKTTNQNTAYTGFGDISVVWDPSDNVKAPSAPQMTLAKGGQGAFAGGIFRMIDQLDLSVTSYGPSYYYLARDNTTSDLGYAFGQESHFVSDGGTITIKRADLEGQGVKNARVLLQSSTYTDNNTRSNVAQAFIELIDAQRFDNLADIIKPDNTGKEFVVTNNSELTINGVYQTRVEEGSSISTWYAYVTDVAGNAIKIVSQGTEFPASFKAGTKIPASGLVGTFRYNYGSPEIVIGDAHRSFLKNATAIADYSFTAPDVEKLNTTPTADKPVTDFNRKVRLRNVRWLAANNEVEDKDGEKYLIYSRLVACDDPAEFTSPMFTAAAGTHWCIEGYVGQVNGKTAIFPTAKVLPCPTKPVLLAPNPVEGDIEAISKTVTVTVEPQEGMSYFYCVNEDPADMETLTAVPAEGIVLEDEHFRGVCELYVYAKSADGLWSTEPATLRITRHSAIEVANIADFKRVFIDENTGAEKKDLFNEDDGSLKAEAIDEAEGIASYYQLTGNAIVVKRTPNYLYLRDYMDGITAGSDGGKLGSMNYLLVYNANQWEQPKVKDESAEGGERELRAGDVITGIALVPELTSLGNLRSNSSTFARTVAVNYDIASDSTKVQPLPVAVGYDDPDHDHYFDKVTVDDNYRMRYYTFEGVKVKRDQTTDPETYTLDIATPVRMSFDIFSTRGGWVPAYDKDTRYTITGIVLRDGEEGNFAIAPISFRGSGSVAAPSVFLTENENNDVLASADIQEGGHTLRVKMTAEPGAVIYYSVNGKNPLDNADAETRKVYTAGEEITLEFAEGQDRAVVMAFAAEPGKTPSAVVTRTFIKSSRELTYLLNFINQGEQDRLYHFNGHVAVAALGGKWMMVRGAVGHYLPIYNADAEWDAEAYKTGGYLTDFVMRYDKLEGNIRGIAEAGSLFPEATSEKEDSWEEITFTPDSVTSISERNARRYVKLHSANVQAAAATAAEGDSDADAAAWTVTGTSHQGAPHALVLDMLGTTAGAETLEDGGMYDITGFVMLDDAGAAQLWATEVEKIAQTARVTVKINGTELTPVRDADTREYEAEFVRGALVTLEVSDPRPSTVIRYSYDNMNWFTYGEPFLVTESVEQIHAVAQALNERESVHTHIKLTRKEESGDVTITVDAATPGKATVTMTAAEEGTIIYWTSKDKTEKTYSAPVVFEETQIVYARLQVAGKTDGAVSHALVEIAAETPDVVEDIEAKGNSLRFSQSLTEEGWVVVTIEPVTPVEGGTIYYTTEAGKKLPGEGVKYEGPIVMKESGVIIAIMTIEGKPASQAYETTIWVVPVTTGIDGIEGEGENAVRVDGSDIIAPQGSEVYDLNGRRVNPTGLASGVYIVRTPDGKAIKVRV